jgi:hypothetical protein
MRLHQALIALDKGSFVRRKSWHNGKLWVTQETRHGFCEPVIAQFAHGATIEWPLVLGRGDWCADDWYIIEASEIDAQRARAKPSQASPKRKSRAKTPKGASASGDG